MMNKALARLLTAVLAISGWLLYGPVHELGHALVAKMAGLHIIHIQPWPFSDECRSVGPGKPPVRGMR